MRIGIIGTRGIPNHYGGFEQFAMHFSQFLVESGHEVVVYNSSNHPYKEETWSGVEIKHIYDPENRIGTAGQFIYDFFSILNSRKQKFDVIFQLGYTSSSIWGFLFPKKPMLITNMDGLEWKRSKYGIITQKFLRIAEKWAIKQSDKLIADSKGIQDYLLEKYNVPSTYIPYGAAIFSNPDESILEKYHLKKHQYNLVISRFEPENNLETIIEGHILKNDKSLCIIGNFETKHGQQLYQKYSGKVTFLGSIFDMNVLDNLRYYSKYYFHGHSVGGTNPSLLEAMACGCNIIAHNNPFNKAVLNEDASYFNDKNEVAGLLKQNKVEELYSERNINKIKTHYSFQSIHHQLLKLITES